MKKYIFAFLGIFLLISACIYLVFSRHENLTITYIKFKVNPEFVIGINSSDRVILYNPLNDDAKIFNLSMFNNKSLDEFAQIFIAKMEDNNYLVDNNIDMIVMTKNKEKEARLANIIKEAINTNNRDIVVNLQEATSDEMLTYSNETVYDLTPTLQDEDLDIIGNSVLNKMSSYINSQIDSLNISKLDNFLKKEILEEKNINGYFDDFDFSSLEMDYDIDFSLRSNYDIDFIFDNDLNYLYNITLYLEFDYYQEEEANDVKKCTVEVYKYTYNLNADKIISNYKNDFYRFSY